MSDKLRSALEWYALPGTYAIPTKEWPDARSMPAYSDGGRRAREALAGSVEPVDGNLRDKLAHRLYWLATGADWTDEIQDYQKDFYFIQADRILALVNPRQAFVDGATWSAGPGEQEAQFIQHEADRRFGKGQNDE